MVLGWQYGMCQGDGVHFLGPFDQEASHDTGKVTSASQAQKGHVMGMVNLHQYIRYD